MSWRLAVSVRVSFMVQAVFEWNTDAMWENRGPQGTRLPGWTLDLLDFPSHNGCVQVLYEDKSSKSKV